ncbi:MAG: hypothetical protein ACE363_07740 [Alphaproteobacteria bacterium]
MITRLFAALLLASACVAASVPPAHAGSVTVYNHDCSTHNALGNTEVHVWAPNEDGGITDRSCTDHVVIVAPGTYAATLDLESHGYENQVCKYSHLARGMTGDQKHADVDGREDSCVTCRKEGFLKLCRCKKVSCG